MKAKWAAVRLGSFFLMCEEEEENNWPKITRHSSGRGDREMLTLPRVLTEDLLCDVPLSLWLPALP